MARCGCNARCNCRINIVNTDPCLTLSMPGIGTPIGPYKLSGVVKVDPNTLSCGPNGLQMKLNTIDTDTINISGDGSAATPLQMDAILTPDNTGPLVGASNNGENLIDDLGPGLFVSCEEVQDCVASALGVIAGDCLLYDDANNVISAEVAPEPNGIECTATGLAVIPSSDANNNISIGTDTRLFGPAPAPFQITPTPCIDATVTGSGAPGDPQILTVAPRIDPNPCNALSCGPAGLFVPNQLGDFGANYLQPGPAPGVGSPCFAIQEFPGCPTNFNVNLAVSDDFCNAIECRPDGLYVARQTAVACQLSGNMGPTPLPAGSFPAGSVVNFFSGTINFCNVACCRMEAQVTLAIGGINAFVDFNSRIEVSMSVAGDGGPFPPAPAGNTFPVDNQIYDTFQFNPGPPGFKNTPLQAQDSFWSIFDPSGAPGACHTLQWRMSISVVQGNIRQFVTPPGSPGAQYQIIITGIPECDCNCGGLFVNPPNSCGPTTTYG